MSKNPPTSKLRLSLLSLLFIVAVIAISYSRHSLLLPLFIGMSGVFKGLFKLLTPKFLVLLFKNSIFLKAKQLLIRSSTRFVVLSHKPWRHKLKWLKTAISQTTLHIVALYMQAPLWLRTSIALGLLFATASSSYLIIALLIIPQPILNWGKKKIMTTLNRTGITHLIRIVYRFFVAEETRHKWYMHFKWTMGRRQVATARRLRQRFINSTVQPATQPAKAASDSKFDD